MVVGVILWFRHFCLLHSHQALGDVAFNPPVAISCIVHSAVPGLLSCPSWL